MASKHAFSERLALLQSWRHGLNEQIDRVAHALRDCGFLTEDDATGLSELRAWVDDERVTIVFIAESSRGKSELINAMFFADLGRRLLPSGLTRTTRCVTELRFDRSVPTSLRMLPIETRESPLPFAELYRDESQWQVFPFEADNQDALTRTMAMLSETLRVSLADAVSWGLHGERRARTRPTGADSTAVLIDVPRWRHAIVNFPHPLLDAGLVILDTPGLSAFFGEPELAQDRVLNADAIVLILDAAEGVSKEDLAVWREHLSAPSEHNALVEAHPPLPRVMQARMVALNKIDDVDAEIDLAGNDANAKPMNPHETMRMWLRAIDKRVQEVADKLKLDPIHIVPISAKLGLIGKLAHDQDKVVKSRVYQLERSLAETLPVDRQQRLGTDVLTALTTLLDGAQARLDEERFNALDALRSLTTVRAKNDKLMSTVLAQTKLKETRLVTMLRELRVIKPMQAQLGDELAMIVDVATAKYDSENAFREISGSVLPNSATEAVGRYFTVIEQRLKAIDDKVGEIRSLFRGLGERMRSEFGSDLVEKFEVHPFATQRFHTELMKLREKTNQTFANTSHLMVRRGKVLGEQFQTSVAPPVEHIFVIAQRESATWLRGLYKSVEKPLEDAHARLMQRAEGIEKAEAASQDLSAQITALQNTIEVIKSKHAVLTDARDGLKKFTGIGHRRERDASPAE